MSKDAKKTVERACRTCGERLRLGARPDAVFCSAACRSRPWRVERGGSAGVLPRSRAGPVGITTGPLRRHAVGRPQAFLELTRSSSWSGRALAEDDLIHAWPRSVFGCSAAMQHRSGGGLRLRGDHPDVADAVLLLLLLLLLLEARVGLGCGRAVGDGRLTLPPLLLSTMTPASPYPTPLAPTAVRNCPHCDKPVTIVALLADLPACGCSVARPADGAAGLLTGVPDRGGLGG